MRWQLAGPRAAGSPAATGLLGVLVLLVVVSLGVGPVGSDRGDGAPPSQPRAPAGEAEVGSEARWWHRAWEARAEEAGRPRSAAERDGDGAVGPPAPPAAPEGDRPSRATTGSADPGDLTVAGTEAMDPGPSDDHAVSLRTVEGFDVAAGSAQAGEGTAVRYTVEMEPAVGADLLAVTAAVEEALNDPRSWVVDHRLERVDDPELADVRVVLATPDTVDELCGEAGLRTDGRYSCWNGTFAALNAMRWRTGAEGFDDLTTYRRYLINHEFGHGLGHGHVDCPAPGAAAPVMMQQTISMGACEANGWPYPDAEDP